MLTALQVYVEPPDGLATSLPYDEVKEFCRNERGRETIKFGVIPTPNDGTLAGEEITIRLMKARRERIEEVVQARKTFTFTGAVPAGGQSFAIDLRTVYYDNNHRFPVVRRGDYFILVEHTAGPTYPTGIQDESEDFVVTLLTTDKLETEWLFGTTRRSNDDRFVRNQPRILRGVRVTEVQRNYALGIYEISLVYNAHGQPNLVWDKGELFPIDTRIPDGLQKKYILVNSTRTQYIEVQVDPRILPNTNTTDQLFIDRQLIDRDTIRRAIKEETDYIENAWLHMPIEPALCVSDHTLRNLTPSTGGLSPIPLPENFDYDIKGPPLTYYPPTTGHWMNLNVPFARPIKWEYLVGALENQRIIDIDPKWIHTAFGRTVQLIPFNQALAFYYQGLMMVQALRGPMELPSFWRYRYWAGIEDETTPNDILSILKMKSAEVCLSILGQAFRGGFSSESVSRDGVSESVSYTASAMYGIYSASISDIRERLKRMEQAVQRKYLGLQLEVL